MAGDRRSNHTNTIMRCSFYAVRWCTILILCAIIYHLKNNVTYVDNEFSDNFEDEPVQLETVYAHKRLGEWIQEEYEDNKYLNKADGVGNAQVGGNGIHIQPDKIELDGAITYPENNNLKVQVKGVGEQQVDTVPQKDQNNDIRENINDRGHEDVGVVDNAQKDDEIVHDDEDSGEIPDKQEKPPETEQELRVPPETKTKTKTNKNGKGEEGMHKLGPLYMPRKNPCAHPKPVSTLSKSKYTLLMLIHGKCKWKQLVYDLTLKSMPRLDQVLLLWNNDWLPPKEMLDIRIRAGGPRVVIIKMDRNSMNNRFMPWSPIRTAAVYIMDMDIRLPGEALEFAFDNWLQHQGSVVGYAYRRFYANGTYPDRARARIFGPDPGYNLVLTGSAMMSYELMIQYACEDKTKYIREMVDDMFNGDDIAMNLISRYNGHRPVALTRNSPELEDPMNDQNKTGCLYDLGVNGRADKRKIFKSKSISTRTGHAVKRQDMFMRFAEHLGLDTEMSIHHDFYQPPADVDLCTCATIPREVMRG